MAFLDKINQVAKNIGDKTTDTIEVTKLNSKISSERNAATEELKKIGEYYYQCYVNGMEVAPEVLDFCQSAKGHFDVIAAAQAEIESIKADGGPAPAAPQQQAQPAPGGRFCNNCGSPVDPGMKFCAACGNRME